MPTLLRPAGPVQSVPACGCGDCPLCDDDHALALGIELELYAVSLPAPEAGEADRRWWADRTPDAEGLTEREAERLDLAHWTLSADDYHRAGLATGWAEAEAREAGQAGAYASEGH